jgi:hypothetical protein
VLQFIDRDLFLHHSCKNKFGYGIGYFLPIASMRQAIARCFSKKKQSRLAELQPETGGGMVGGKRHAHGTFM